MEKLETEVKNESKYLVYFQPGEDLENLILKQVDGIYYKITEIEATD